MRIVLFWSYYEEYVARLYRAQPSFAHESYDVQRRRILEDHFGWVPPVLQRLADRGHEVEILVTNAFHLQKQWACEHGVPFSESNWRREIPALQVRHCQPDIVFIGSMFSYYGDYLRGLRQHAKFIVAWIAVPTPPLVDLQGIQLVLTSHQHFLDDFRRRGLTAERMLPAFEPYVLDAGPAPPRDLDVSFVGSLTWLHQKRIDLLRGLLHDTDLRLWVSFPPWNWKHLLRPRFPRAWWSAQPLLKRSQGTVFGRDMYYVLRRSWMTVNMHLEGAHGLAGNMRMFEATGAGALLLSEDAPNLPELFQPGEEMIAYRSPQHLRDEIRRLLRQPEELARIAAAGQQRTLRDHNTIQRAAQLEAILHQHCR